jgi:hypothetical protein
MVLGSVGAADAAADEDEEMSKINIHPTESNTPSSRSGSSGSSGSSNTPSSRSDSNLLRMLFGKSQNPDVATSRTSRTMLSPPSPTIAVPTTHNKAEQDTRKLRIVHPEARRTVSQSNNNDDDDDDKAIIRIKELAKETKKMVLDQTNKMLLDQTKKDAN